MNFPRANENQKFLKFNSRKRSRRKPRVENLKKWLTFKSLTRASLVTGGVSSLDPNSLSCCSTFWAIFFVDLKTVPFRRALRLTHLVPRGLQSSKVASERTNGFFFFFLGFFLSFLALSRQKGFSFFFFRTKKTKWSEICTILPTL